jgi:hypothetical protein
LPKKLSYEEVKERVKILGYKLLSKEIVNTRSFVDVECDNGHQQSVYLNGLLQGNRSCKKCHEENMNFVNEELIGKTFGFWKIESISNKKTENHIYFNCKCICGTIREVRKTLLLTGKTISCGCSSMHNYTYKDKELIIGKKYGRLTVISGGYLVEKRINVDVKCDCGIIKTVLKQSLESGSTQSCGCLNKEILRSHYGLNHHNYNPNLTDEERKANSSRGNNSGYQLFRRRVLKKFNNTCVCCGFSNVKNMRVHHLNGWNIDIENRFNINNATVLCPECHDIQYKDSFHFIYKNGNNTKEQFEQFIEFKNNQMQLQQNMG